MINPVQYTRRRSGSAEQRGDFQGSSAKRACEPRWPWVGNCIWAQSIDMSSSDSLSFILYRSIWYRELSKDTTIFLQFKNKELEMSYVKQREALSSVPLIASLLVHVVAAVYSSFILPSSAIHFFVIIAPIILTLPMVWISIAESFPMVWPLLNDTFFWK